ncbi:thioredoxin, partial [Bacillus spizizenii]|nr:thioredoxin [Bacillus spizizenii]
LLLFIEGTESLREARFVKLEQKFKRVCQLYEE